MTPLHSSRRPAGGIAVGVGIAIVLVLIVGFFVMRAAYSSSERDVTTVVTGKERVCSRSSDGGSSCEYLVFTDDGTFKINDSTGLLGGPTRFSSSDLYGQIEDGPAEFTVIGWRLPFFSQYPNVVSYDPIEQDTSTDE